MSVIVLKKKEYTIGDGFYDPTKRIICNYNGEFKRDLEPYEE